MSVGELVGAGNTAPASFVSRAVRLELVSAIAGESQVRQNRYLSPFRYPGGKTSLAPYIRFWLHSFEVDTLTRAEFVEPFAGGGSIALTVAYERLVNHVTMVELDELVASVWQTILSDDWEWLANRILKFPLTTENVEAELSVRRRGTRQKAFQTVLLNRVNYGGNMTRRARRLRKGEDGKGIRSRWYPEELSKRIQLISDMRDRITFIHGDGVQAIQEQAANPAALFFIDPPYTAGGKMAGVRLYRYSELDHTALFDLVADLDNRFLMTYDDSPEIRVLAHAHGFQVHPVRIRNKRNELATELFICRELGWLADFHEHERTRQLELVMPDE